MMQFWRTTRVELRRIFKRKVFYVFLIALVIVSFAVSGLTYYSTEVLLPRLEQQAKEYNEKHYGDDGGFDVTVGNPMDQNSPYGNMTNAQVLEHLRSQSKMYEEMRTNKNPQYNELQEQRVNDDLAKLEKALESKSLNSNDKYTGKFYKSDNFLNAWSNLAHGPMYITLIFIALASILSLQVAGEFENGSIKFSVMKAGSRVSVLLAKFTAVVIVAMIIQVCNYLLHLFASAIFFGWGDLGKTFIFAIDGQSHSVSLFAYTLIIYGLSTLSLIMPLSLVLLLAVVTRSNAGTITASLAIYMLLNSIVEAFIGNYKFLRYTPFVHMNLENNLISGAQVPGMSLYLSAGIAALYFVIFLVSATIIFKRKDI